MIQDAVSSQPHSQQEVFGLCYHASYTVKYLTVMNYSCHKLDWPTSTNHTLLCDCTDYTLILGMALLIKESTFVGTLDRK